MPVGSQFHSVANNELLPTTGNVGDCWFVQTTGQLWFVISDGSLHELLVSNPIPVAGPQGEPGIQGVPGSNISGSIAYFGSWQPSPQTYSIGSVVSWGGLLYLAIVELTVNNNSQAPPLCPVAWQVLGPSLVQRSTGLCTFIDGAGQTPPLGVRATATIPFDGAVLSGWSLVSDQPGDAVLDVLWASYNNYPSGLVSIVGSSNPSLTNEQKNENLNVSSLWSPTTFSQGDTLQIVLDSVSTVTQLTLTLFLTAES